MKKLYFFAAAAVLAAGLVFTGCDLLDSPVGNGSTQEKFQPLVIEGENSSKTSVKITFSTERTYSVSQSITRASARVMTPDDNDSFKIELGGKEVSTGKITVGKTNKNEITFNPATGADKSFTGTLQGTNITFPNNQIPLKDPIEGFKPVDNSTPSSSATEIAKILGSNAEVNGSDVLISGNVTVKEKLDVPSSVKLVFITRKDDVLLIQGEKEGVTVTAGGGIEVRSGKELTISGTGVLALEKSSTLNGNVTVSKNTKLDVTEGAAVTIAGGTFKVESEGTLNVAGSVIIENGGTLTVSGELAREKAYNAFKNNNSTSTTKKDAVFKGKTSGSLLVKSGGTFEIPDPKMFDISEIKFDGTIEAGGQVILLTVDPSKITSSSSYTSASDDIRSPFIGTVNTSAGDFQNADWVMDPVNTNSKIIIKFSSGSPKLTLEGKATALGAVNTKTAYDATSPTGRNPVWVSYEFTVAEGSVLEVGSTSPLFSEIRVTGSGSGAPGIGSKEGSLINKGTILIYPKATNANSGNGIFTWYNGNFTDGNKVYKRENNDTIKGRNAKIKTGEQETDKVACVYWGGTDYAPGWLEVEETN